MTCSRIQTDATISSRDCLYRKNELTNFELIDELCRRLQPAYIREILEVVVCDTLISQSDAKLIAANKGLQWLKSIGQVKLIDHGVEHVSNLQVYTNDSFDFIVTGQGNNLCEAVYACLKQIMDKEYSIVSLLNKILSTNGWTYLPTKPDIRTIRQVYGNLKDIVYHVSIAWSK